MKRYSALRRSAVGLLVVAVSGEVHPWWLPLVAAIVCAALGVVTGEAMMRRTDRRGGLSHAPRDVAVRFLAVAVDFAAGAVVAAAAGSVVVGVLALLLVVFVTLGM